MIVVYRFAIDSTVAVEEEADEAPRDFELEKNYPNPFNPNTVIRFQLSPNSQVMLQVFELNGREVATLVEGNLAAGKYAAPFTPRTAGGQGFISTD